MTLWNDVTTGIQEYQVSLWMSSQLLDGMEGKWKMFQSIVLGQNSAMTKKLNKIWNFTSRKASH